jgi:parvulin-like peptidyl-prolyl isomerase
MSNMMPKTVLIARTICMAAVGASVVLSPAEAVAQTPSPAGAAQAQSKPKPVQQNVVARTSGSQTAGGKTSDEVVAHVGATDVTASELRAYVGALGAREQAAFAKEPALLGQAVRLLLGDRLVLEEALAKKFDQQPNVSAQLDQLRERALVELYLQSVSTPPASYPSDDELQKTYDANRSAFLVPRQFQLGHIFVAAPKDDKSAEDKAKKTLDDVQRKLKATGADFAAIARAENDAKDGGELGWVAESQIRPEIRTHVMGLAKNAISEPIRLDDGWHIVKLIDTKPAYTRSLAEARDQLGQQMRAERATLLRRAFVAELLKQHPPMVNEFALSNVLAGSSK